jgi:hypothetical protein
MAVYKPTRKGETSKFYVCEFVYQGKRFQESTGATSKTVAKEYEKRRKAGSATANSTNRGCCRSHLIWSSALLSAASRRASAMGRGSRTHRCSPARTEVDIPSPRCAARFMTR